MVCEGGFGRTGLNRGPMQDDRHLIWRLRQGDREALRHVYVAYKDTLLTLAFSLLHDMNTAEDVLHDVFVSFAGCVSELELRTSLRQYLTGSVLNRVRDRFRREKTQAARTNGLAPVERTSADPEHAAALTEEARRLVAALAQLPLDQREVITLRLNAGMRFRQIAEIQKTSVPTVQGRYRYGIEKLRALLGGEP
jgi:RNA polymerase sigma factor (sigma-70 family)